MRVLWARGPSFFRYIFNFIEGVNMGIYFLKIELMPLNVV